MATHERDRVNKGTGTSPQPLASGQSGTPVGASPLFHRWPWLVIAVGVIVVAVVAVAGKMAAKGRLAAGDGAADERIEVFVGLPPLAFLARRVGGGRVNVTAFVKGGQDPHMFEPSPREVMALTSAKLFFTVGMPFEQRLTERLADNGSSVIVVDASQDIDRLAGSPCCAAGEHDHEEHAHDDHETDAPDPHVWLSPANLKTMARSMAEALAEADPGHAAEYRENAAKLVVELDEVDARVRERLAPFRGRAFYVFHPAFGYFARDYGLRQQAVETEGKSPSIRQLQSLIKQAQADGVRTIFVQPQFDRRSAEAITQAIGGTVEPLDSLAEDVVANLDELSLKIARAMPSGRSEP